MAPWIAALLLQILLVGVLTAKKMWGRFPFFFSYCVLNLTLGVGLFVIFSFPPLRHVYFRAYWLKEGLGLVLGFAVVYEVFRHLLTPYPALRRLATTVFQVSIALLAVLACVVVCAQPSVEHNPIMSLFLVVEEATRILEVGLLAFLFLFASTFGLHWRQYAFGIALGLGIFIAVELLAVVMRIQFGNAATPIFNIVRSVSFNSSLLIWIGYILAPELATKPAEMPKRAQLEQWNRAIMELIYQ